MVYDGICSLQHSFAYAVLPLLFFLSKNSSTLGESRGRVVKGEDSQLSGYEFESMRCILDGVSGACYYIGKRYKGSQMGHTKKYLKK
jgi:hypothetical protein